MSSFISRITPARSASDLAAVRELFVEYARRLGFGLEFQDFQKELDELPGPYGPPTGSLLLARVAPQAAGCLALRRIDTGICEMKRLYVRPAYRGQGLGLQLAKAIIAEAVARGYHTMRLDTVP